MNINTSTSGFTNLTEKDVQELLDSGYERHSIKKVEHFSATSDELTQLLGFNPHADGLAFLYKDVEGNPVQYRDGLPFVRVKMRRTPEQIEVFGKYNSPKDGGAHLFLSDLVQKPWAEIARRTSLPIIITEGEKKADVLCQEGFIAIGVSGVNSWVCKKPGESHSSPLEDFKWFDWNNRVVYLCPDSDVSDPNKPQIRNAMKDLAEWLTDQHEAVVRLIVLPSALDGSKLGADDFIKRYDADKFRTFINHAQPALKFEGKSKNAKRVLNMTPPDNQRKAEIISWALAENYATRSMVGWYEWIGSYWKAIDDDSVRNVVRDAYEVQGWRLNNEGDMTYAIKENKVRLKVADNQWNKPGYLIFTNGVYNPSLKIFSDKFDKTLYSTTTPLPFPYSTDRREPTKFLKFLSDVTGGDKATIELLQAIMKYTWMPKDRNQKFNIEACFDFYGGKGTGKSTFLEIIQAGLGQDAIASADPVVFSRPELLFDLLDKKAAISTDVSGHLPDVGVFNRVISNETVLIRKLKNQSLTTRLGIVVLRSYNRFLSVGQGSQGLDRRMLVVHFNRAPKTRDTDLLTKLMTELPNIFFWAFSLSDSEMERRINSRNNSELAAKASIDRFIDNNPIFQFLMDNYEEKGAEKVKSNTLYIEYEQWCTSQHFKPCKANHFRQTLEEYGCTKELKADGTAKNYGGYPAYKIPAMKNFNLKAHLGLTDNIEPVTEPEPIVPLEPFEPLEPLPGLDPIAPLPELPPIPSIDTPIEEPILPLGLPMAEQQGDEDIKKELEEAKETGVPEDGLSIIDRLKERVLSTAVEPVELTPVIEVKPTPVEKEKVQPQDIEASVAKVKAAMAKRQVNAKLPNEVPAWLDRFTTKNPDYSLYIS